jgi:hypothetical protein
MTPEQEQELQDQDLLAALETAVLAVPPATDSDATAEPESLAAWSAPSPVVESSYRDDIPDGDNDAKTGPPKVAEWQDFFSRIIIRYGTDFYMNMMLRDIDPELLSPADLVQLKLTSDDRKSIARPFAEFANKSKWARKNGRMIVSSADSVESAMILMKWARTVSRIGRKYRKPREKTRKPLLPQHQHQTASQNGAHVNGNLGPGAPAEPVIIAEFSGN